MQWTKAQVGSTKSLAINKANKSRGLLSNKYKYKYRGGLLSNGSLHSLIDNEIEAAVEEKKREKVRFFIKKS